MSRVSLALRAYSTRYLSPESQYAILDRTIGDTVPGSHDGQESVFVEELYEMRDFGQ